MTDIFTKQYIYEENKKRKVQLNQSYETLGLGLDRQGIDINLILDKSKAFSIAIPSWGVGTGGTRFARFPGLAEPRNIFEKLEDCSVINQLTRCTEKVSPHFPWDSTDSIEELRQFAIELKLKFDSINSNTFQDTRNQKGSYKFGSLTHTDRNIREHAIDFNIRCIEYGKLLGSNALNIWIGDGSNLPGQQHFSKALSRYIESARVIYSALPDDWNMFIEHKMFEPSFYSTVIQDWGTNILCAQMLGEKARSLVDLGHHAPNTNIEMIVSRLLQFDKLAGFHFNDSKYGDDDLDSGSINPYQQFLIFNELVDAEYLNDFTYKPRYMLDQSHNVTDPIESLMISADSVQRSYVQACLVDREKLYYYQNKNDAIMASQTLKNAFNTDVSSILEKTRLEKGGAIDPLQTYRKKDYRKIISHKRPEKENIGSGIV